MILKSHILKLNRIQTSQNRDLKNGALLDRNERVDYFNSSTFKKITKSISRYSLNATPDVQNLYKILAKEHGLKKNNIYIGQGITEIISHILFSVVRKGEEAVFMHPTYPMYEVLCKLHNIKFKLWKFDKNLGLNLNDFRKLINTKTKVVFLINPNLPIEYEFKKSMKDKIRKLCNKKKIVLVYDEAYYHFGGKSEINNVKKANNLIVMRTFSKAWGLPGIRLGYMAANEKLCQYISKCRSLVETNAFSFQIAQWAMKNKKILKEHIKQVKSGARYLKKKLESLNEDFHGGNKTNAVILKLKNKNSTNNLVKYLSRKKVYIRSNFPDPISNYVRISLGSPKKLSKFIKEYSNWKKI